MRKGKHSHVHARKAERRLAGHSGDHARSTWPVTRALLAGGMVLACGLTGVITLAAWTEDEVAQATFSASKFGIQSSVDLAGAVWVDTTPGSPATLPFSAAGMSPSTTRYAGIGLRTSAGSLAGTISLGPGEPQATTPLAAALKYRVVAKPAPVAPALPSCGSGDFSGTPTYIVGAAGRVPLTTAGASSVSIGGNQSGGRFLCFEVSMDSAAPNSLQSAAPLSLTWTITGTSDS